MPSSQWPSAALISAPAGAPRHGLDPRFAATARRLSGVSVGQARGLCARLGSNGEEVTNITKVAGLQTNGALPTCGHTRKSLMRNSGTQEIDCRSTASGR